MRINEASCIRLSIMHTLRCFSSILFGDQTTAPKFFNSDLAYERPFRGEREASKNMRNTDVSDIRYKVLHYILAQKILRDFYWRKK